MKYSTRSQLLWSVRPITLTRRVTKKESSKPLLGIVGEKGADIKNHNHWRWRMLSEARTKLINAGIPIYPTIGRAARAVRKLVDYYRSPG